LLAASSSAGAAPSTTDAPGAAASAAPDAASSPDAAAVPDTASNPEPAPKPDASAAAADKIAPLREIGHVKATTPFCQAIIDHAVKAVTLGIDNDRKIAVVVQTIRSGDFDSNLLSKNHALWELSVQYSPLTEQAIAAEKAAKALRVDAEKAPTPEEAKSLTAFADALDGALHRQRTIARDLGAMIAIFNMHPNVTPMERDEEVVDEQARENYRGNVTYYPADKRVMPLLSTIAKNNADDFVTRQEGIVDDERSAANLVEPVFGGC
jgi:hypothetical protein